MTSEYGLIVSFPDQSESFVLGFEAGIIWNRLESGERDFTATVHESNREVLHGMAEAVGLQATMSATEIDGWSEVTFARRTPRLHLVKGGLSAGKADVQAAGAKP